MRNQDLLWVTKGRIFCRSKWKTNVKALEQCTKAHSNSQIKWNDWNYKNFNGNFLISFILSFEMVKHQTANFVALPLKFAPIFSWAIIIFSAKDEFELEICVCVYFVCFADAQNWSSFIWNNICKLLRQSISARQCLCFIFMWIKSTH